MSDSDPRDYRSLGDLLRDAREERKLGYEQVNEATRISVRVIQALETDDLEGVSGPIYARGFVRTLADERGLAFGEQRAQLVVGDAHRNAEFQVRVGFGTYRHCE